MIRKPSGRGSMISSFVRSLRKYWQLYLFILPTLIFFLIWHYYPMYGVQIAFRDFMPTRGIWGSKWVGLKNFFTFYSSFYFWRLVWNTLSISLYQLLVFPLPIILALSINEVGNSRFKKTIQTITYAPHFISTVVMCSIIIIFCGSRGIVNNIVKALTGDSLNMLGNPSYFKPLLVLSGSWQGMGWGAIIYLGNLASVDMELHEAAQIDGATRLHRMWYINIPCLIPTIVVLLVLQIGNLMSVGFEKVYLLQNGLNLEASEIISTYVYKVGLTQAKYSLSAAAGFMNSVINLILLFISNSIANKTMSTGLW